HRPAVRNKIVVNEIDRSVATVRTELVKFGNNLGGSFETRIATIQARDVAEFALIGATAGKLNAADKIPMQRCELVGRHRKLAQLSALPRREHDLIGGSPRGASPPPNQPISGISPRPHHNT